MLRFAHTLTKDDRAAVLVYVTIILAVVFGVVGLAIDGGRFFTTHSQAQDAADAAALAAASQLDGAPQAIDRAVLAAQTAPLVQNSETFAEGDGSISIAHIRFLHSLPADDQPITSGYETTDPSDARFVEVTTQDLSVTTSFARAAGAADQAVTAATAVAGYTQTVCEFPPLMICNPWETATEKAFPPSSVDIRGVQILAKTKSGDTAAWAPGDFGLLDPADGNTGAKNVAELIASATPKGCYNTRVNLRPGVADSIRAALNTRFDIYENPYFAGAKSDSAYRPARNVTKGMVNDPPGNACSSVAATPPLAQKLPRDTCLETENCVSPIPSRIGDAQWDRASYWSTNHGGAGLPIGLADASRFDVYRYEIDNGMIPNIPGGENGAPQCSSVTPDDNPDRRVVYMAVINCTEEGPLTGSSNADVRVKSFLKAFITEPVGTGTETNIWLEIVDQLKPGADDGVLHDIVQLYR